MHPSEALSPRDIYGARVTAAVLDLLLIAVSAGPLAGATGWLFAGVFSFVYLGIVQGITGWTLSKALLGTRVVKSGTTSAPGPIATAVRWVLAPLGIPVVTAISSAFDDRRRGLGDRLAGTEVIGLAPEARPRVIAIFVYVGLLGLFIALSSIDAFLILTAIFAPMVVAGVVVVLGSQRMKGGTLWLAGLGFAFVGAALMTFQGLCKRGGGVCADLDVAHQAIPTFVMLVVAMALVFTVRGIVMYVAVAALAAVGEIWMFFNLRDTNDMGFAGALMLVFLAGAVAGEIIRHQRRRAEERDRLAQAALT